MCIQTLRDRETQLKVGVGVHQQLGNDHLLPSSKDSNNGVAHSVGHGVAIGEHGKEHPHGSAESAAGSSTEAAEREPKKGGKDGGESKPQGEKVEVSNPARRIAMITGSRFRAHLVRQKMTNSP